MNLFKKKKKKVEPTSVEQINPNIKKKPKKAKEKTDWTAWFAGFISVIVICGLICLIAGLCVLGSLLKDKPELDLNDFQNSESSIVYDRNGEVIAELGATIRENISYDDLPNNVIDAFVAAEDSRFFEHNGFDLPRFTMVIFQNLKSLSFSAGASTFTMQLVKNTYFTNDDTGQQASRSGMSGVKRKVQEIALALELEKEMPKEKILELYLNKLNYGGGYRNIRGIQKASYYYFGKPISEVDLSEAAFLAGVINAPSAYNPYNNLEAATNRRNTVLYLMHQHGYINDSEYQIALNTKLENSLIPSSSSVRNKKGSGNGVEYQAYIDTVVAETYELTGLDPYTTTMKIYTAMDPTVQTMMDRIQKGDVDDFEFPDDNFELASIATDIKTGEIVGVLGGRNYADGGALLLNHATQQYEPPGSSIKPIIDYVLAFEHLGWATDHVLVDKPVNYVGTDIVIGNSDGVYRGQVTLSDCIGYSLNTTAIQTIQQVVNKIGVANMVDYLNSVGFNQATVDNFNVQWGIGGLLEVNCKQMASAMGTIINKGEYYTPHTIKKIEFENGKAPVEPNYLPTQAISEQASYLMSQILYKNVNAGYANLMYVLKENDYAVYGKTGTTDWGISGRAFDIPDGAIKDGWCVGCTSDFAVATWVGYEKAIKNEPSYMTLNDYLKCVKEKTTNLILDSTVQAYGKPDETMERPSGISTITHIIGVYPYASPIEGMDEKYITTGEIITKYAELVSPDTVDIESISDDCKIEYDVHGVLTLKWPSYPDKDKLSVASETMDLTLDEEDDEAHMEASGHRLFDYSWVYGAVKYKANITITDSSGNKKDSSHVSTSDSTWTTHDLNIEPGDKISVDFYYGYDNKSIDSNTVNKKYEVVDEDVTITNIQSAKSISDVTAWAKKYGIPEGNCETKTATTSNPAGTVAVYVGDELQSKATFKVKQSKLKTVKAIYYEKAAVSLVVTSNKDSLVAGDSVTITATVSNQTGTKVTFTCNDLGLESHDETISGDKATVTLTDLEKGSYTIKVKCDSKEVEFKLEVKEKSAEPKVTAKSNDESLGTVEISGSGEITITAHPLGDNEVKSWSGSCSSSGTGTSCKFTPTKDEEITVTFGPK